MTVGIIGTLPINAVETTEYSVETKSLYSVNSVGGTRNEGTITVDYVTNPNGGPVLGILHVDANSDGKNDHILEEVDGIYTYAFKDMDKDGVLDKFEDWRLSVNERAQSLATDLASTDDGIEKIAGLMLFSAHERDSYAGLTDAQIAYLDGSYVRNITDASGNDVKDSVGWTNAMQAHVEASDFNVPVDFSSDPRSTAGSGDLYSSAAEGSGISAWPSNIGLAATFDVNHMYNFAKASSAEYRAMGIVTALGPQIDLATEPRWVRYGGTFGENVQLATDMAQAYVDGSQSTYAADGSDLGWGTDSINAMIKHFPGDGAGEGGRESHTASGKYAVFPGSNLAQHLLPFSNGGMNLNGKTGSATAVMTSYSIGINADGSAYGGEENRKGSAYNTTKMDLLRNDLAFDGVVCTDWGVTSSVEDGSNSFFGMAWGAQDMSVAERHFAIIEAGSDMFGGNNDSAPVVEAFEMYKDKYGETAARERFATSARRLIKLTMEPGLFENPYLDAAESTASAGNAEKRAAGYNAQLDSIVMLKNADNTIQKADAMEKDPSEMTVYIPTLFTKGENSLFEAGSDTWSSSLNIATAKSIYGTVITDELQPDGTYKVPDLTGVDKAIVGIRSPMNGGTFSNTGRYTKDDGTYGYYPLSLQYAPYTADGDNVRKTSIAGDINADGTQENRSYYGETSRIYNEYDLTVVQNTVAAIEATGQDIPLVIAMNASGPAIVSEIEEDADAIIVGFSVSDQALFDVINGNHNPRGLLPMQFPKDMDTVEANKEDVGQDMVPYFDSQGNTYDFGYGLNWDGVINDDRVATYNPSRPGTIVSVLKVNASNFALTNTEAKDATEKTLIAKAKATASWDKVEKKAKVDAPITLTVNADQLAAVKKVSEKGGTFNVTFTATSGTEKAEITVTTTVSKADVTIPSTAGNGTDTGDTTDVNTIALTAMIALLLIAGSLVAKKKRTI